MDTDKTDLEIADIMSVNKLLGRKRYKRNQHSHWWVMDNAALKTLSNTPLIHRTYSGISINARCNNTSLQSL